MYQNAVYRQMRIAALIASAIALGAGTAGAQDIEGCQRAIVKGAQKYSSARMKALQKCEEGVLTGKITSCPDTKATDKINKAAAKLNDAITKKCGGVTVADLGFAGKVSRCVGGALDGNRCVDNNDCIGGGNGVCTPMDECPTYLNGRLPGDDGCEIALTSPADVGSCLICADAAKVDSVIATFYGTLNPASTDKDVLKCQKDIGKRTAKHFDKVEKALAKCQDALIKGKVTSCPDAKATDKIDKARTKFVAAIAKTCTNGATISDAAKAGEIWGESARFGDCPVSGAQTAPGLSTALGCLAENAAACDVALSAGDNACSTQLCGNGQIDPGETCDDGNTTRDTGSGPADICPADCAVAACSVTGTQSVTVNITVPEPIVSGLILLSYNDGKVSIPGVDNQPPVLARVSSLTFAVSPRDTDTALRIALDDPTTLGQSSGAAATVTFDVCSGASLTVADLGCVVVDAGNTSFENITGATCSVSVP